MHSLAADLVVAIRLARQPMPALERQDASYRQWATAILLAEITHVTDDFWRCAHAHGAGPPFDHHKRVEEARPFRFQHEVRAIEASDWLGALNIHEGWKSGPWGRGCTGTKGSGPTGGSAGSAWRAGS